MVCHILIAIIATVNMHPKYMSLMEVAHHKKVLECDFWVALFNAQLHLKNWTPS